MLAHFKQLVLSLAPAAVGAGSRFEPVVLGAAVLAAVLVFLFVARGCKNLSNWAVYDRTLADRASGLYTTDAFGNRVRTDAATASVPVEYLASLKAAREEITLFHSPLVTLRNISMVIAEQGAALLVFLSSHPVTKFFVLPVFALWAFGSMVAGPHQVRISAAG